MSGRDAETQRWDYIISPKHRWFDLHLKEIWQYRDLCFMYVKRNIIITYQQTILGPLWFVIQPIFTIIIFMFIFGGLAGLSTEGVPQPLFYMAGILLWNYFSECFTTSNNVFTSNYTVFGKVYFPRLIVPIAGCISSLAKFGIQLLLFIGIYIWCYLTNPDIHLQWEIIFFPVLVMMLALHGIGWGLLVSSVTYKYRDIHIFIGYMMQLLMYVTPVVYPLDSIPEKYKEIVSLNPISPIFEAFKYGCFGRGSADWGGLLYSFVFLSIVLFCSTVYFNKVERTFMDTV